ncbi:hypothetical protein HGRIS_010563 [Hohenbuehelia grisea]|uniref:Uncharacterized protein n=1 Tax=Hohenbuehelia grisea TaxID=104357 RepID=A0ABR3IX86_9AGAR
MQTQHYLPLKVGARKRELSPTAEGANAIAPETIQYKDAFESKTCTQGSEDEGFLFDFAWKTQRQE